MFMLRQKHFAIPKLVEKVIYKNKKQWRNLGEGEYLLIKKRFLNADFCKILRNCEVFIPIQKFDFTAKTFGRWWDSNLRIHSQKREHYHSAIVTACHYS